MGIWAWLNRQQDNLSVEEQQDTDLTADELAGLDYPEEPKVSYPDDEPDTRPSRPENSADDCRTSTPVDETPLQFSYLSSRLHGTWRARMTGDERILVSDYLEALASAMSLSGTFLGPREVASMSEAILRDGQHVPPDFLIFQPWASPIKHRRQNVIEFQKTLQRMAWKLADRHDVRKQWLENMASDRIDEGRLAIPFDIDVLKSIKNSVEALSIKTDDPVAHAIYRNMEYALACCGERESMARMSGILGSAIDTALLATPSLETHYASLRVAADGWLRLSMSTMSQGGNPRALADEILVRTTIDLRWLEQFADSHRMIVPYLSSETKTVNGYEIRDWRDDRYSTDIVLRTPMSSTVHKQIGPVEETEPKRSVDTSFRPSFGEIAAARSVRILSGIGVSASNSKNDMEAENAYRPLLEPLPLVAPTIDADGIFDTLRAEFPWMHEANKAVAMAVAKIPHQKTRYFHMPPTLLIGPPGIGKTRWIRRVCEITGLGSHGITLSGIQNTMSIVGSERGWASARPSFMTFGFKATMIANPIFHVDELDKGRDVTLNSGNIEDAFLPMLEKETSGKYPDNYLLGELDLSWSTFLFSANDLSKIGHPLKTRLRVLHISKPSRDQIGVVIRTMIQEAVANTPMGTERRLELEDRLSQPAMDCYTQNGDLRAVSAFIQSNVDAEFWSPRGLKLVR